jgi:putative oxygen-independent coproporphyrinogen III oxidase
MSAEALPEPPDAPALADAAAGQRAAYVHVPFCRRVCPYCDFAVIAGREDLMARYPLALLAEIHRSVLFPEPLSAVSLGGGTPSRLPPVALTAFVGAIVGHFGLAPGSEVSIEANPEDWSPGLAEALVAAGFNRVSLGAQSFDPGVLRALGRAHRPEQVEAAVAVARRAGFGSVGLDLIFGTPGESGPSWRHSLERALDTGADHLSAYALTVERGTPLSRAVAAGAPGPDPDRQADLYEEARRLAAGAGLVRYETSNFARPGHACLYNLITWARGEYEGFGAGAHRHRGGSRTWNVRRVDRYLERVEGGVSPVSGGETLGPWQQEQERLVLGLRRAAGVEAGRGGRRLLASAAGRRLIEAGVLEEVGDRLRVARPLLANEAGLAVLALEEGDC